MHTENTDLILNKLIALTSERDVAALEITLAQMLYDLVGPLDAEAAKSVVIYHAVDVRKQVFTAVVIGKNYREDGLSSLFRQALAECFQSGECHAFASATEPNATLYPLKDSVGNTTTVIAIEPYVCTPQQHKTIGKLLQIYQNFTGLINDNERDTLTGLLNRKTFENKVNKQLAQMHKTSSRKDDKPNSLHYLAIFDIDFFKRVNDTYGHQIGDEVLLLFAQLMAQTFRSTDALFRFGGEEFVGVFECESCIDIENILDRFKSKVGNFNFPQIGQVTVSVGYTEMTVYDTSSQLIDRSDMALYYAKHHGRNRICFYEQLIVDGLLQENKKEGDVELF
jgi:diguanylate cyclase (GGDEF)-like protein